MFGRYYVCFFFVFDDFDLLRKWELEQVVSRRWPPVVGKKNKFNLKWDLNADNGADISMCETDNEQFKRVESL